MKVKQNYQNFMSRKCIHYEVILLFIPKIIITVIQQTTHIVILCRVKLF